MTKKEHIKIHKELHKNLDKLVADFVYHTAKRLSNTTILELIQWSFEQTKNPIVRDKLLI